MQQLVFVTVFLGLIAGTQPVELLVPADVAKVELRLDGRAVAVITRPPWRASVDFGDELLPHRLEAVALDAGGAVVATAAQKVNASTPAKELQLALDESGQRPRARILWSHLDASRPQEIKARLDGNPVSVGRDLSIDLPPAGDGRVHLLDVSVRTATQESDAQLVFGAMFTGTSTAALTAIPVRVRGKKAPDLADVTCTAGDQPVRAVALDDLPAQVILVRDPSTTETAARLSIVGRRQMGTMMTGVAGEGSMYLALGDQVRFLWPVGRAGEGGVKSILFPPSRWYSAADNLDVHKLLTALSVPLTARDMQFADAVAVAALQAAQSQRPRAVVLVIGSNHRDASRLTPAATRAYARRLGVPLYVWSLASAPPAEWGVATEIGTVEKLRSAIGLLRRDLDAQRVLWVEGDYLAHEVAVRSETVESLVR